jgi:hypothetical protein
VFNPRSWHFFFGRTTQSDAEIVRSARCSPTSLLFAGVHHTTMHSGTCKPASSDAGNAVFCNSTAKDKQPALRPLSKEYFRVWITKSVQ